MSRMTRREFGEAVVKGLGGAARALAVLLKGR